LAILAFNPPLFKERGSMADRSDASLIGIKAPRASPDLASRGAASRNREANFPALQVTFQFDILPCAATGL
jgi:hypothetical protein